MIRFNKMHGLGNDYVYVDCFAHDIRDRDIPALSHAMSDRHRGIGSDGLILIAPPEPGVEADVRMEMYNADGSRGEMCGNGIRCVAKYAVEHGLLPKKTVTQRRKGAKNEPLCAFAPLRETDSSERTSDSETTPSLALMTELNTAVGGFLGDSLALNQIDAVDLRVQTDRGVLSLIAFTANGLVRSVRVEMGAPILEPSRVPVALPGSHARRVVRMPLGPHIQLPAPTNWAEACGLDPYMACVSMGNPHVVLFCKRVEAVPLESIGPFLERQPIFPNRINVHFAACISRGEARMRSWERGAGITQACGTGACAVLVAGVLDDRLDRAATLHLPGGDLFIEWPGESQDGPVFMTGPAEEVFSGEWKE